MIYQEFKQQLLQLLQKELDSDISITIQDIIKNNGIHLDGLTLISPGYNISPTIYLNHYFNQYEQGKPLPEICHDILYIFRQNRPLGNVDISFFTNYDNVKTHIVFKLINYQKNKELLTDVPHLRFLDLAIVFCCLLKSDYTGNATILIHNNHLDYWKITADDLYALARENTPRLLKSELRSMTDVLNELFSVSDRNSMNQISPAMYVLTNQSKLNGAICILYPNLLKEFADSLNCDLYILPSSVHEVLLISATVQRSWEELAAMIQEINCSQLSPEEVLSEHPYYFDRKTEQILAAC